MRAASLTVAIDPHRLNLTSVFEKTFEAAMGAAKHDEDYAELTDILDEAFDFVSKGKGAQRHATRGQAWRDQPHVKLAEAYGLGFPLGQAAKKIEEGNAMDDWEATRRELLGAIGYLCSAIYNGDRGID